MDAHLRKAIGSQDDVVAVWQLRAADWTRWMVEHRVRKLGWREIHDGVYATNQAPLTRRQLLRAATLTAPKTHLNALSSAHNFGFHVWEGEYETVVRPGSGGKRMFPGLLIARSQTLDGDVGWANGLPTVGPERALIDLAGCLGKGQLGRGFREACRLNCTSAEKIGRALHGQRGTAFLAALCDRYAKVPYHRCRSDAECRGLEVLVDAGIPVPDVNVRVAGREADYVWRRWRLIVEVHSKEFHPFEIDDADKKARWEAAGYTVLYIWANDIYHRPKRLPAMVTVHLGGL
jgi:hypothetical protein